MSHVVYQVVEHDGGWAYRVGPVYSEPFPTHEMARRAARDAAARQRVPGETEAIEYEDANGAWHDELDPGTDRPSTAVADR